MDYLYQNSENLFDIYKLENSELMVQVKVKDFSGQFAYCIEDSNLKDYISSLEELDKLIGLDSVKNQLKRIRAILLKNKDSNEQLNLHMCFYGACFQTGFCLQMCSELK